MFTRAFAAAAIAGMTASAAPLAPRQLTDRCVPLPTSDQPWNSVNIISDTNQLVWTPTDYDLTAWTKTGLVYDSRASSNTLWKVRPTGDHWGDGYDSLSIVLYSYDGSKDGLYATGSTDGKIASGNDGSAVPVNGEFSYDVKPYDWAIDCSSCGNDENGAIVARGCRVQWLQNQQCATMVDGEAGYDVILQDCDWNNASQSWSLGVLATMNDSADQTESA